MEFLEPFIPATNLLLIYLVYSAARFENQRWARAQDRGLRGSSNIVYGIVQITFVLFSLFTLAFWTAFFYDFGWQVLVSLVVLTMISIFVSTVVLAGDHIFVWIIGTVCVWPMGILLAGQVSWFGFLSQ